MNLQHLCSALHAEVYFDKDNGWVFIDWEGDLTLHTVQHTCLEIARCFLDNHYPRVLNSNAQVTSVSWEVSKWLGSEFLPALRLTGIEQMAWVAPPKLRTHTNVLNTVNLFPHTAICLFEDMEEAVAWLQQTAPLNSPNGWAPSRRLYADELKLRAIVKAFAQQLEATPVNTQPAL
jgi:hypothetical protein